MFHLTPGPLSREEVAQLKALAQRAYRPFNVAPPLSKREDGNGTLIFLDDGGVGGKGAILAKITLRVGSNPYLYNWAEQTISPAGVVSTLEGGRSGTHASETHALELTNASVDVDTYVLIRQLANGVRWFDKDELGEATTTSIDVVTNVCLVASGDTHTLTVQKQTLRVPSSWLVGDAVCETNPLDCCPVTTSCGDCPTVPYALCATFTGVLSGLGTITLSHDPFVLNSWNGAYSTSGCSELEPEAERGVHFFCSNVDGLYYVYLNNSIYLGVGTTPTCDPFEVTFSGTITLGVCSGSATVVIRDAANCPGSGGGGGVVCCEGMPSILTLTETSGCACAAAAEPISLTYNASGMLGLGAGWYSTEIDCSGGDTLQFALYCNGGYWILAPFCNGIADEDGEAFSYTCDPFSVSFSFLSSCCGGVAAFTVTE